MIRPMRACLGWARGVTITLLPCFGVGLVSIALPEAPEPSGYYDGDDDDAAATPERSSNLVPRAAGRSEALVPAPTSAPVALSAGLASPSVPGRTQPPPLRSPPA